jgi:predicted ATPase
LAQHTDHYLRLAERITPSINTSARQTWLAVLEREHSNLRIVLGSSLVQRRRP